MSIVETDAHEYGVDHFSGVNTVLEVAAGNKLGYCVNPIMFGTSATDQLYVLTDFDPTLRSPIDVEFLGLTFDRPGLTIKSEVADATKLTKYHGKFDAVFMRNFLGDPTIHDDDKCRAVEESLLCLRTPKVLGASALWVLETYTPDFAARFISRMLSAYPIFSVEHATVTAEQTSSDSFADDNYPLRISRFSADQEIYKITHSE